MNGVLLIDKPSGPTSHDVVARIRRVSGERRVGHTGTLDPLATGLLPLVLGQATRLASILTGGDKTYEAGVRLGFATTTDDQEGAPLATPAAVLPDEAAVDVALEAFRGAFDQVPPQHSAKKVGGRRAYDLARRDRPVELAPVRVVVHELHRLDGPRDGIVRLRVRAGSGFYVRALARDLGERLGCGAHLAGLRRVASGTFDVADAIPLEDAERLGPELASRVIPPAAALADVRAVTVTAAGAVRVRHGNLVGPEYLSGGGAAAAAVEAPGGLLRVLGPDGALLALARPEGGALHPTLVLG